MFLKASREWWGWARELAAGELTTDGGGAEFIDMKSAYELAMERLNKSAPAVKLTNEQKKEMGELDSVYASKIAQREIFLKGEIAKAEMGGDFGVMEELQKQLVSERKALNAELEEKKEKVRKKK